MTGSSNNDMSVPNAECKRCREGFAMEERMVNCNGEIWHERCFVCSQCFQQFPDGMFFEFEGRKYCEHDFHVLFAPCCGRCGEFVIGRVIKAMNNSWHPDCFTCQICGTELADTGFIKNQGRALCRPCHMRLKAESIGKYICYQCNVLIEEGGQVKFKMESYHPYHFNCYSCGDELTATAREVRGQLYCLRCHDRMGIPICGACRRPIEERVVHAMGKTWHTEHFVCAFCEKPFLGHKHYEHKGLAYCDTHFQQLFGNVCFYCNKVVDDEAVMTMGKAWCPDHFFCSCCDTKLTLKSKFVEIDNKPVCKRCYDKFPNELKKRLKKGGVTDSPQRKLIVKAEGSGRVKGWAPGAGSKEKKF